MHTYKHAQKNTFLNPCTHKCYIHRHYFKSTFLKIAAKKQPASAERCTQTRLTQCVQRHPAELNMLKVQHCEPAAPQRFRQSLDRIVDQGHIADIQSVETHTLKRTHSADSEYRQLQKKDSSECLIWPRVEKKRRGGWILKERASPAAVKHSDLWKDKWRRCF